ncbi:MAG: hypothetical protein D6714_12965 [Bacteroidetes bacterium]|nr:MAG: hypothetical protein D6714_12965 [Bacteroidota bacterium]
MRLTKIYLYTFLFLLPGLSVQSQTSKQYEKKAQEAYAKKDYSGALAYYKFLLEVEPDRADALFYAGVSAARMNAFPYAEGMLARVPDSLKTGDLYLCDFYLADVKKRLKKYDEAIIYFQKFIENKNGLRPEYVQRAQKELDYCEWALENLDNVVQVDIIQYDTLINTYRTDFAPLKVGDALFYTSSTDEDGETRIFCSVNGGQGAPIPENVKEPGKHNSHTAFGQNGRRMYFTICESEGDAINEFKCRIFYRNKTADGGWGTPYPLSGNVNMAKYTTTQPAVAPGETEGEDVLYFVSDRPCDKAGMNIWRTIVRDTGCTTPVLLNVVNTDADDLTPFFHAPSASLFFSSNGHQGFGGLDIFRSVRTEEGTWSEPENLGLPINSTYDDLYYSFNSDISQAHFASNRPEALCNDPQKGCTCDDIFYYDIMLRLDVLTFNVIDSSELMDVQVELVNVTDNQSEYVVLNRDSNAFHFPLLPEKAYRIIATKEGYETATAEVNTKGVLQSTIYKKPLYLRPRIDVVVLTYDAISREPLPGTAIQLTNEWTKRDSSILNDPDSNEVMYPLDFGQDYTLIAAKQNYSTAFDTFSTKGYTTPTVLTRKLYLTPFTGLPLTLYFDNDKPRWAVTSKDTTTRLTYEQTYQSYIRRKNTFIYSFSAGLFGEERQQARDSVRYFFEREVEQGYKDLMRFSDILADYLRAGNRIEIVVEGYASPLAPSDYNKNLTARRISSVINQFKTFNGGILAPFIENKSLTIVEAPKGEDKAPKDVDDDPKRRRNSVFSPVASRQRRVRILDIRRQENIFSYSRNPGKQAK